MKVRINPNILKRIAAIEGRVNAQMIIASWPKMMEIDEWSELAQPMQEQLCRETREDPNRP